MQVGSVGREDPLEREMATHTSILAWEIPWIENPIDGESWWDICPEESGWLQSWSHKNQT